jgi:hypothetical protein
MFTRLAAILLLLTGAVTPSESTLIAAAPQDAQLRITYAGIYDNKIKTPPPHANVRTGHRLNVGIVAATYKNGYVTADSWDWGVSQLRIYPYSSVSIISFGKAIAGGRVLELLIRGKVQIDVRYLTQSSSKVKACFFRGGCIILRSGASVSELPDGRVVVGLRYGHGVAQDYLERTPPVTLLPRWFSIMALDGSFSPAQQVNAAQAYKITYPQTRSVQIVEAKDGYKIVAGRYEGQRLQLPKNVRFKIKTPLD